MKFILLMCLGLNSQAQTFLKNLMAQTVVQPMIEQPQQYIVTPAIGTGTYSNSLTVQNVDALQHTNSNFYIFGLDINGYSSHIFLPFSDKSDRVAKSVDSDVFRFQTSFKMTPQLTIDGSYTKVIGFYTGRIDDPKNAIVKFPNLGMKKYSLVGTYMLDSTHQSSLFSPISYAPVKSGSSAFFSFETNHHELMGLDELNPWLVEAERRADSIQSAKALSMLGSFGWSQSKMYQNFFWSYAIGVGFGGTYVEKYFADNKSTDALISTTVPFGGTFGWNSGHFTTGLFAMVRSWAVTLEQFKLSNSNGSSGLYLAYQF